MKFWLCCYFFVPLHKLSYNQFNMKKILGLDLGTTSIGWALVNESENKGNRKYFTFGAGFKMSVFSLDAGYVVATAKSNPLDQTLRFSLSFDMDGIKDLFKRR